MSGPLYYDNVFEAITKDPVELLDLTMRADLIQTILGIIRERGLDARQVSEILGVPAPRVSELMRAKVSLLTIPKLIGYLGLLGYQLRPLLEPGIGVSCPVLKIERLAA